MTWTGLSGSSARKALVDLTRAKVYSLPGFSCQRNVPCTSCNFCRSSTYTVVDFVKYCPYLKSTCFWMLIISLC